jgi:hypothetical protein
MPYSASSRGGFLDAGDFGLLFFPEAAEED